MLKGKGKILLLIITLLFTSQITKAQEEKEIVDGQKALNTSLDFLKKYFSERSYWYVTHPETERTINGLIQFIEKQPFDSIHVDIKEKLEKEDYRFVYRLPEYVYDSLDVPGYYPATRMQSDIEKSRTQIRQKYYNQDLEVPVSLFENIEEKAGLIPQGQGRVLFDNQIYYLPDSLQLPDVIPDSLMQSPNDFKRFLQLDSIRERFIEQKRIAYNDSILDAFRAEIIENYRRQLFEQEHEQFRKRLADSVRLNNFQVLRQYNEEVVTAVNDSISAVIDELVDYANYIDTTRITMTNLLGDESTVFLQDSNPYFSRVWLKNQQNDSLRMMVKSTGKRSVQFLIDDGVAFSRFKPRQTKDFDFSTLNQRVSGLTGVQEKYQVLTPWRIGGDGSVGFTQTYLENWKKGGQSALSLQIVLRGYANYSRHDGKVKWENSSELRNGYIRPGGEGAELQKNDDKFEITSRIGVSAFKKWFYSSELNFETQLFRGYRYPTSANPDPISAFMAPARTFFKVGLDYKPNNDFSLFLSPITAKNVFVRDTVMIDKTKFGIMEPGKRSAWEPGLNTDIFYRKKITDDITYETKYKMFINYLQPKGNLDINWENLFTMKLTDHINMRLQIHLIYDENVLFPVYDANDVKIDDKPKLQLKEFFTIGFAYKINKQVTRTRRK